MLLCLTAEPFAPQFALFTSGKLRGLTRYPCAAPHHTIPASTSSSLAPSPGRDDTADLDSLPALTTQSLENRSLQIARIQGGCQKVKATDETAPNMKICR